MKARMRRERIGVALRNIVGWIRPWQYGPAAVLLSSYYSSAASSFTGGGNSSRW